MGGDETGRLVAGVVAEAATGTVDAGWALGSLQPTNDAAVAAMVNPTLMPRHSAETGARWTAWICWIVSTTFAVRLLSERV